MKKLGIETMIGRGRDAIEMIFDQGSVQENVVEQYEFDAEIGPGAVVGTAKLEDEAVTFIASDAQAINPRFNVVYFGVIGMEEAYKMALAVYRTMEVDKDKPLEEKRPIVLIVDTPGNGPGKIEEIIGMNLFVNQASNLEYSSNFSFICFALEIFNSNS